MNPEMNPSELDALRLKRDIDRMVEKQCPREDEYENFQKQAPRKTKPKKHDQSRSKPIVRPDKAGGD